MKHLLRIGGPFVRIARCHRCNKFYLQRFWGGHKDCESK